ncbi:hypothetical protein ACYSNX_09205 [Myroides sp. LJL115]
MAVEAEQLGVSTVIVNQPFKNLDILKIKQRISIPIISSVSSLNFTFKERFESEVSFFNIMGRKNTIHIIDYLRENFPDIPFVWTGGKTMSNLSEVLDKKVYRVVLTSPPNGDLFKKSKAKY